MKKVLFPCLLLIGSIGVFIGCSKSDTGSIDSPVSAAVLAKIKDLGFGTSNVVRTDEGYLVEGDITLTDEVLNSKPTQGLLRVGDEEQYRTTNVVTGLPRVITVKVVNLGTAFVQGADLAISRYNALGLRMTFQRITSGTPSITIQGFNQGPSGGYITLGSSGFPTNNGNPYGTVKMNTNQYAYGTNP